MPVTFGLILDLGFIVMSGGLLVGFFFLGKKAHKVLSKKVILFKHKNS